MDHQQAIVNENIEFANGIAIDVAFLGAFKQQFMKVHKSAIKPQL
jgi:hypothetical protein